MHIFDSTAEEYFGFCIDDDPPKQISMHTHTYTRKTQNAQKAKGPLNFMTLNNNREDKTVSEKKGWKVKLG